MTCSFIVVSRFSDLMMSTAEERMSTLAPVRRRAGSWSMRVILAVGKARRRQREKIEPAIPAPTTRTLGGGDWEDGILL